MPSGGTPAEQLGPYRLVRRLGRGGMGEVWLAEHEQIKSQVAIKLVLADPSDDDAAARFLREARATARIRHPGIVAVTDFGERPAGGAYLVMELLDGESLAERLQRGALPVPLVLELGAQIAEALSAAHAANVIHRDLKPANVFLVPDAAAREGVRAKLLDFGIAKAVGAGADELGQTTTGAVVGTPVYMAPEQCTSRLGPIDHRADLYALGVVLYEMATGAPPFRGRTFGDLIDQHLHATPTAPRVLAPSIPSKLDVLIVNLLAKERDDRPGSASDVARVLDELRGGPGRTRAASLDATLPGRTPAASLDETQPQRTPSVEAAPAASVPASLATQATGIQAAPVRPRRSLWIALGTLVLAGAATGVVLRITRDSSRPAPPTEEGDDALERACTRSDGNACLTLAKRELRDPAPPDLARVYARLVTSCERGIAEGCAEAAVRLATGTGVRPDYGKARALATDACKAESALGCQLAGELVWHGIGGPIAQTEGVTRWRRGCELGNSEACLDAAKLFRYGLGVPKDDATSRTLFARAHELAHAGCVKEDARACVILGQMTVDGAIAPADPLRGADHLLRACELGNAVGCANLGEQFALGTGVAQEPARAAELLQRGCERGDPEGCVAHGLAQIQGAFGEPDGPAGLALVRTACEVHGDRYCGSLGLLHAAGFGTPKDTALAKQYLDRACAAGDPSACSSAADLVVPGEKRDPARLEALHHRACQLGSRGGCLHEGKVALERGDTGAARVAFEIACSTSEQQAGCDALADMYLDGTGVAKDPARGRALLEDACRVGAAIPCYQLARRLLEGRGLERHPGEALTLFDKACQIGVALSCVAAADVLTKPPRGITADVARAKALRERACALDATKCVAPSAK